MVIDQGGGWDYIFGEVLWSQKSVVDKVKKVTFSFSLVMECFVR